MSEGLRAVFMGSPAMNRIACTWAIVRGMPQFDPIWPHNRTNRSRASRRDMGVESPC